MPTLPFVHKYTRARGIAKFYPFKIGDTTFYDPYPTIVCTRYALKYDDKCKTRKIIDPGGLYEFTNFWAEVTCPECLKYCKKTKEGKTLIPYYQIIKES